MEPSILWDFAQAKYGARREGNPAARLAQGRIEENVCEIGCRKRQLRTFAPNFACLRDEKEGVGSGIFRANLARNRKSRLPLTVFSRRRFSATPRAGRSRPDGRERSRISFREFLRQGMARVGSCSLEIQEMEKMVISDEISDLENMNFRFVSSPMKHDELSPRARTSRAVSMTPVSAQKGPRITET